ncbi:MAG: protein-export chaperone SecB [Rhodospirillaceae bacterium]|nr:protein-export chaperone SecB [Rhodospirillaceae bacterium]
MTDSNDTGVNQQDGTEAPPLIINGQYIKDLSFEAPNTPIIFNKMQDAQPDLNVTVDLGVSKMEGIENTYEVTLNLGAEMKIGDEVGFITELKYAGVFTINVPEENTGPMLMIECPRILFPYARNVISNTTRDGGFMPLTLQPIDFVALYQKNAQNQQGQAAATTKK